MSTRDRYTIQFLFYDRRPVAGFLFGGSRAGKDSGVCGWVGRAGDKEEEGGNVRQIKA